MQDMLNEQLVRARGCGDIDSICFGVPLHYWNPLITHIKFSESYHCFFKVMPGLHLLKKIIIAIEFVGQARVSPTAIFPESASDNHHCIPLPLLPTSPHPRPSHLLIYIPWPVESLKTFVLEELNPWLSFPYQNIITSIACLWLLPFMRASRDALVNPLSHRHTLPCSPYAVATPIPQWKLGFITLASLVTPFIVC